MLKSLKLNTLEEGRTYNRLVMMYKISRGLVPAVDPAIYLVKSQGRIVKPKVYSDYKVTNIVNNRTSKNTCSYKIPYTRTPQYKNSFFVRTLVEWNHLDEETAHAQTVEGFKSALQFY